MTFQVFHDPYEPCKGNTCPHVQFQKKIHTHPKEDHQKFLGGEAVLNVKILEAKYEAKLEFSGGGERGGAKQKPSVGEYGYFLELHNTTD